MTVPGSALYDADDARLLNLVAAGNDEAFGVLSERHAWAARKLARLLVPSPEEVKDVVAEAFGRVLAVTRRGGGPSNAFRPYALNAVRRVCEEPQHGQLTHLSPDLPDQRQLTDPGAPIVDPAVAGVERTLAVRAYLSLPERWRAVLWHTEIEQEHPLVITPLLGLARDGIAELNSQAIDGLRQAFVQLYVASVADPECRSVGELLDGYVRDELAAPDVRLVSGHLSSCSECQAAHYELAEITATLRGTVGRLVLGSVADAYLLGTEAPGAIDGAGGPETLAMSEAAADHGPQAASAGRRKSRGARRAPRRVSRGVLAAAGVALVVLISGAVALALNGRYTGSPSASSTVAPPHTSPPATQPAPVTPSASSSPSPRPSPVQIAAPVSPQPSPTSAAPTVTTLSASMNISAQQFRTGTTDQVSFDVTNTGPIASGPLTAAFDLPDGSTFAGQMGGSGWSCNPSGGGVTCTHAAISPGQHADGVLAVSVSGFNTCGRPVRLTVSSGSVTAQAQQDLRC